MSKPLIGINCPPKADAAEVSLGNAYYESIERAGGIPVLIPPLAELGDIPDLLRRLDGLLLVGGGDIDPAVYGQDKAPETRLIPKKRETFDLELARRALALDMPLLGICLGCQEIVVAAGGTLIQHLPAAGARLVHAGKGSPRHVVSIEPGSKIHALLGCDRLESNTSHHQAIDEPGPDFRVVARAADGIVEAAESTRHGFAFAIQWHPERLGDEAVHCRIFEGLVRAAAGSPA